MPPLLQYYFTNSLDVIDCVCAVSSVTALLVPYASALRVLRAIRLLTHIKGARHVLVAVVTCLPVLSGVVALFTFVWLAFALLGVQLFQGVYWSAPPALQRCSVRALCARGAACGGCLGVGAVL